MWQVIMFYDLEELNNWLMEESDNIEEVKEYKHKHHIDYYQYNGEICNEWSVLVKMKGVKLYVTIKEELLDQGDFTKGKKYQVNGVSDRGSSNFFRLIDDEGNSDWIGSYMVEEV